MYLNPGGIRVKSSRRRLIATYDVFEFSIKMPSYMNNARLIATYDVFEYDCSSLVRLSSDRLIATYDVFECKSVGKFLAYINKINSNIRCI